MEQHDPLSVPAFLLERLINRLSERTLFGDSGSPKQTWRPAPQRQRIMGTGAVWAQTQITAGLDSPHYFVELSANPEIACVEIWECARDVCCGAAHAYYNESLHPKIGYLCYVVAGESTPNAETLTLYGTLLYF